MPSALEQLDATLETTSRTLLGDTISLKLAGQDPVELLAIVDYGEDSEQLGARRAVTGDCAVEIPLSVVATRAAMAAAEITLPKRPGETLVPKNIELDETGMSWLVVLKKKPA